MNMIISAVSQGLLWSILALGLFVSFRILDLADMTTEGAFPLGAAVAVQAITLGANPYIAIIFAIIAGSSAGLITGFLITKLQIPSLLAGILTMTGLYSINLRVMGRANISLLGKNTIFTVFEKYESSQTFRHHYLRLVGSRHDHWALCHLLQNGIRSSCHRNG